MSAPMEKKAGASGIPEKDVRVEESGDQEKEEVALLATDPTALTDAELAGPSTCARCCNRARTATRSWGRRIS